MFNWLKEKYSDRMIWNLTAGALVISVISGLINTSFLTGLIDGVTLCSALLLLAGGIVNKSFGAGYSFMLSKKKTGKKISELMEERYEAEKNKKNPALFAGLLLLGIMIILLVIYYAF
ncbi:MAG: hypothetical protein Q4D46_04000 [Erysipelotrichaceae bacterium]|nr:hypothetical protein [Erysipelotrichaceae bacterium]MDO5121222.1 hypothetical protein [Erysipelotrichaceae bacterium]